jgi:hypothetical protein
MSIPTVEDCYKAAASWLGDPRMQKFRQDKLEEGMRDAYERLVDNLSLNGIKQFDSVTLKTLTAGTTSLTVAAAGISNLGAFRTIEERRAGSSTDQFLPMAELEHIVIRPAFDRLLQFEWRNNTWTFSGATVDIELRITYDASGQAPVTGTTGIDNSLSYFRNRIAATIGPPNGFADKELIRQYYNNAEEAMYRIIGLQIKAQQNYPIESPAYTADPGRIWPRGRPPIFTSET